LLALAAPLRAEPSVSLSVDADRVGLNDSFSLTVGMSGGDADNVKVSGIQSFNVLGTTSGNSISIVNGRMSSSVQRTYTLSPKRTGSFTLGPATLRTGGKVYRSESAQVTVVSGSGQNPAPAQRSPAWPFPAEGAGTPSAGNVKVKLVASPQKVYVNQQITLTFYLYHQGGLSDVSYSPPQTVGFVAQKLKQPTASRTTVNGQTYIVEQVPTAMFAVKPGKFTLGPASLTYSSGFFDQPRTVSANPVTVVVSNLPVSGRPVNFDGAVGSFRITASLDKVEVKRDEAATLTATVTGTGNISSIRKLTIPTPPSFRVFESSQKELTSVQGTTVTGSKTFEYVLVPDKEGKYALGSVSLPIFNPATRQYLVAKSQPLALNVLPGAPTSNSTNLPGLTGPQPTRLLREDIRYIKGDRASLAVRTPPRYQSPWYFGLHLAGLFLLAGVRVYRRRVERFRVDEALQRTVRGSQAARKWLREAESRSKTGSAEEFYAALSRALIEYLAARLNVPAAALSADSVPGHLAAASILADTVAKVVDCLGRAEFARFAPAAVGEDDKLAYLQRAREAINELEQVFRNAT